MKTISGLPLAEEKRIAFDDSEDEYQIYPIIDRKHFEFTRRWFQQRNQSTWSKYLYPAFPPTKPYNMIQIGVFEGQDLVWCMQHLMSHPDSRVVAIDPWLATRKISAEQMAAVKSRAKSNLSKWRGQIDIWPVTSDTFFENVKPDLSIVNLAVIDGDHTAEAVYRDACNVLPLMRPGGWMVFDDVRNRVDKKDHVQDGLVRFYNEHKGRVTRLWSHRFCDCLKVLS